jgi:ferredoxin
MGALLEQVESGTRAFLCGSEPFMEAARRALLAAGIDNPSIQEEHFTPPTLATEGLSAATVTLSQSGVRFPWRPDQGSILAAAACAGVRLAAGCRAGECESCAVRLSNGVVRHTREVDGDMCLTCCAVPIGDVILEA